MPTPDPTHGAVSSTSDLDGISSTSTTPMSLDLTSHWSASQSVTTELVSDWTLFSASASTSDQDDPCPYQFTEYQFIRFPLMVLFTGSVCCLGLAGNVVSVFVLTRQRMQTTNNWFLVILALFDIGVLIGCFLIIVVKVIFDYAECVQLYELWFAYIKGILLVTYICQAGATYATAAATIERFLFVKHARNSVGCLCSYRSVIYSALCLLVFVVCAQLPKYFETRVIVRENCTGFGRYKLVYADLGMDEMYTTVYSLWIHNILFVFLPFGVLLVLNLAIFYSLTRKWPQRRTRVMTPWLRRILQRILQRKTKQASLVLLIIVLMFLVCNLPSVILTFLEHVPSQPLLAHPVLYEFSKDLVNILAVINSSATFLVYLVFGRDFRKEIASIPKAIKKRLCWQHALKARNAFRRKNYKPPPNCMEPVDLLVPSRNEKRRRSTPFAGNSIKSTGSGRNEHEPRVPRMFVALP